MRHTPVVCLDSRPAAIAFPGDVRSLPSGPEAKPSWRVLLAPSDHHTLETSTGHFLRHRLQKLLDAAEETP
jgi:hypothetical protein